MFGRLAKLGCVLIGLQLLLLGQPAVAEEVEKSATDEEIEMPAIVGDEAKYLTIKIKKVPTKKDREELMVIFSDQDGDMGATKKHFDAEEVDGAKWVDMGSISLIGVEKSPMKVWVTVGDTDYCFEFDDNTGAYLGRCD